jgi:peptide/nickel transport system substrate-binding protein
VLLIDQLKEIYIDGTLNAIDTTQWYPTVMRKDYAIGLTVSENGLDDPDQQFYEIFHAAPSAITPAIAMPRSIS